MHYVNIIILRKTQVNGSIVIHIIVEKVKGVYMEKKQLRLKHIITYALGDIYGGGAFFIIGALFLVFLTDIAGLKPILAGTVLMIGEIWDAVSDPVMGFITDNTRSRRGRRRTFFVAGIIPIFLSFFMLWIRIGGEGQFVKFVYYLFAYLFFNTAFTMVMVPYNAMPSEMTDRADQRSKMMGVRMMFSLVGTLMGAVIPMMIIQNAQSESKGYILMGLTFAVIFALPWYFIYKVCWERQGEAKKVMEKKEVKIFIRELFSIIRNKSMIGLIGMFMFAYVAIDIFMALFVYYLKDYLCMKNMYSLIVGVLVIGEMICMVLVIYQCSRRGNAKTYRTHMVIWLLGLGLLMLVTKQTPVIAMLGVGAVIGCGLSGAVMVPYNSIAFVVDTDELLCGRRREGMHSGLMTLIRKSAQAAALFLLSIGLQLIGYKIPEFQGEVVVQSTQTVMGIRLMFIVIPTLFILAGILASFKYKIDVKRHKAIVNELERRRRGESIDTIEKYQKQVIEEVTGIEQ